jgi:hypothetical protein
MIVVIEATPATVDPVTGDEDVIFWAATGAGYGVRMPAKGAVEAKTI